MNERINGYLNELNRIDHQEAAFRSIISEITMREYRVLAMVEERSMNLKEVAGHRAIAAQGIGRLVERLRRRELIRVDRNKGDKREKLVSLTRSGRALLRRCHAALQNVLQEAS